MIRHLSKRENKVVELQARNSSVGGMISEKVGGVLTRMAEWLLSIVAQVCPAPSLRCPSVTLAPIDCPCLPSWLLRSLVGKAQMLAAYAQACLADAHDRFALERILVQGRQVMRAF